MSIFGALIGGAFSLLGARSNNKAVAATNAQNLQIAQMQRQWALEDRQLALADQATQFTRLRQAAEDGGFNPLAVLGVGQFGPPGVASVASPVMQPASYMGTAIAESGLMLADAFAKSQAVQMGRTVQDLNRQRDILQRKLTDATLRPKIPGVFGTGANPLPQPQGGGNASSDGPVPSSAGAGNSDSTWPVGRPLSSTDPVDPRRGVDNKDVPNSSGFMIVDNPYFGKYYFPTIDGDEPLDLLQAAVAAPVVVPQLMYKGGHTMTYGGGRESRPNLTRKQALEMRDARNKANRKRNPARFDPNHRDGYFFPYAPMGF